MAFWRRESNPDIDKKQEEEKLSQLKEWIDKYLQKHDDGKRHQIIVVVPIRLNWTLVYHFDEIKDYYLNKGWRRAQLEGQGTTVIKTPTSSGLGPVGELSWLYLYR